MFKYLFLISLFFSLGSSAQNILDTPIQSSQDQTLSEILEKVKEEGARIYFLDDWLSSITPKISNKTTLGSLLNEVLFGTDYYFLVMDSRTVVILKDPRQEIERDLAIRKATREDQKVEQIIIGGEGANSKERIRISGILRDQSSGDPIPFASIQEGQTLLATTDASGSFSFFISSGVHAIVFNFVEFNAKVIDLIAYDDGDINVTLEKESTLLEEVVVEENRMRDLTLTRIGSVDIPIIDVKRAPSFLGEADIIKQIQNLPGVTSVGEAASGFNVRGGSVDQNLILYDGLPVFNSSHVFGFFSSFSADAIKRVTFIRSGIPSFYGGRVSSILDIESSEGNTEKWSANGGLGMITTNLTVKGPLRKAKTSMMASVRSTYSNWLVQSIRTDYADLSNSEVNFYDATIKVSHLFNENTRLSVSAYSSRDGFQLFQDSIYQWNNLLFSTKLDRQINQNLGAQYTLGVSSYGYSVTDEIPETAARLSYRLVSTLGSADYVLQRNEDEIKFGAQITHYSFSPGTLEPLTVQSNTNYTELDKQFSIEAAIYGGIQKEVNSKLNMEYGLRLPFFGSFGPEEVIRYTNGQPRESSTAQDTVSYGSFQPIKAYVGIEPRFSMRYLTGINSSIKIGYNRINQYLHLVTNTTAVTPIDIWQPSGYYFKPQRADQISFGYFYQTRQGEYSFSSEVYYKYLNNLLDFKDGADLTLNESIETELLQGKGYSYGIETALGKNTGRLTAQFNYTYSRTFRKVDGQHATEKINDGKKFASNFDQPHVFNFSWKYALTKRHFFTGSFVYHSGRPITLPVAILSVENTTATYFSERNKYRIPDYHRLDIALVIEGNHRTDQRLKGAWVFSVYNVYARKNPYSIFFQNSNNGTPRPYRLSIIGTAFPSITYKFTFQ